jgi:ankyrin repeat protein
VKRFNLPVLCAAAAGVLALVAHAQKAPTSLATLIQSGQTKLALEQIKAGADVNSVQPDGTSPLIWAIDRGEPEIAEALIAKKADPNATNEFGANPLTMAARHSDERVVKALLDAGAKADCANPDGETALMMAITAGDVSIVQMLINAGANVNTIEKLHNQTPLMYAAASTNRNAAQMVKLLLAKDADVRPRALYSDWPSQITSEPRTQYRSVGGLNALLYAARSGCYGCVEDLLAHGADVNKPTPEAVTPLMIALDNEHNDVAKLLMDKGANIHVWDWWGRTALWIAVDRRATATAPGFGGGARGAGGAAGGGGRARGGPGAGAPRGAGADGTGRPAVSSMDIINALLSAGANENAEMNFHRPNAPGRGRFSDNQISTGTTPLFRAVQNSDMEVIRLLLAKGADPNINTMGYTAFLLAAGAGPPARGGFGGSPAIKVNMQVLDLMIQHGADVNAKVTGTQIYSFNVSRAPSNNEGTSALHEAARSGRTDLVKYLIDHGANPDILDAEGKKAIDVAGVLRPVRGGGAAPAAAGRGGPGRGPDPAAVAEIRSMLEATAAKK